MPERMQKTRGFFISSMRVRKELIPVEGQNSVRCVTIAADNHSPDDTVVADMVAFENILIELNLMKPRNLGQKLMAKAWIPELDRLAGRPKPNKPLETLLSYID